jgi:hypothetical protein
MRNTHKFCWENLEGRDHFEDTDGELIVIDIRMKKQDGGRVFYLTEDGGRMCARQ